MSELILYSSGDGQARLQANIFVGGELSPQATVKESLIVAADGKTQPAPNTPRGQKP